jgi:predicted RNA-binding Zn ribbon-like protein
VVTAKRAIDLELVGGNPALDLANTLEGPRDGEPGPESLTGYGDFVAWAAYAGVIDAPLAGRLARAAHAGPNDDRLARAAHAGANDARLAPAAHAAGIDTPRRGAAATVLARARALRAAVYAVFRAVAAGEEPPPDALAVLAAEHAAAAAHARLEPAGARFQLGWEGEPLDRVLWPLAQAAVDLLRTGPLDRVKVCADCRWLFLDASRNRSRRWCSMNECGGRLKMRRYRARRATAGR